MLIEGMSLDLEDKVISVVGGGGKTSFILRLAGELAVGERVIITTTTQMERLCPKKIDRYIFAKTSNEIKEELRSLKPGEKTILLAEGELPGNKVDGISSQVVGEIKNITLPLDLDYESGELIKSILVEADGSNRKPLKGGFKEYEPVIPKETDVVVFMVGIDALGKKLTDEHVHRAELTAKMTGLSLGATLNETYFRKIVEFTALRAKQMSVNSKFILFINKVDTERELNKALPIAKKLSKSDKINFDRIILGSLQAIAPVKKVII